MISSEDTKLCELNERMKEAFDDGGLCLMMLPAWETREGLIEKAERSLREGKNLLPEAYGWDDHPELEY